VPPSFPSGPGHYYSRGRRVLRDTRRFSCKAGGGGWEPSARMCAIRSQLRARGPGPPWSLNDFGDVDFDVHLRAWVLRQRSLNASLFRHVVGFWVDDVSILVFPFEVQALGLFIKRI
jgi:hypothetical protein